MNPRVGVSTVVLDNRSYILMGKRKGSHGAGTWDLPGGWIEYGERPSRAAARECMKKCGISVTILNKGPYTNDVFTQEEHKIDLHCVTLYFLAFTEDIPELCEPDECEEWEWFHHASLPSPLFLPVDNFYGRVLSGR